jgi:uncharacterized DUF497 family protein
MDFEWDNQKHSANIAKHGIDFEFAKEIFGDVWLSKLDITISRCSWVRAKARSRSQNTDRFPRTLS